MDYTELAQFVSQVGFPIVAFGMMYYMCMTTVKENTQSTNDLKDAINRLNEKLDVKEAVIHDV